MKAIDRPLTKIINGTTQFVIPVFQRDYTWTESQCGQLWSDVVHAAESASEHGHFLGSVVYIATGDNSAGLTRWLLIDGQQRLTTLTLMVAALRDYILATGWTGGEDDPTPNRIDAYFLKNLQETGLRQQKLVLRRHDQATLSALIDGTELPEEPSERIAENYGFFLEQMSQVDPAKFYRGIGRLIVVDVALDRQSDDPQLIFESLNSTGIDLSQSDLIRNFILMRLSEDEQTTLYENFWSKIEVLFRGSDGVFDTFARDYVALKTQASKQEKSAEIYYAFRRFFPDFQAQVGGLKQGLSDLLRFARYYAAFSLGRGVEGEIAVHLGRLRRLVDVPAVLVMRLFDCFERSRTLTETEFVEAIATIESYIVRRAVCGYQTRAYWQVFANLAYRVGDDEPLTDLKVELARLHENSRFPDEQEFKRQLVEGDLYGLRVCRFLLERLENFDNQEPTDTSNYTIEHIMPQNLTASWRSMLGDNWKEVHQTWLHRLGNLTLTAYNSEYQDRPFEAKKTIKGGFSDSSVRLNKFVREQPVWTSEEIERRTKNLAERCILVWPDLKVEASLVEAADQREMREFAARRDATKVKMSVEARSVFDKLRPQIQALDPEILEIAETNSVSYHNPRFFLEVLPRRYGLTLLLALDFNEVEDTSGLAQNATQWKFFVHAKYEGGVSLRVANDGEIEAAMPLIRQARAASSE